MRPALFCTTVIAAVALLSGCAVGAGAPGSTAGSVDSPPASVEPQVPLSELKVPQDPRSITGPSTAVIADPSIPSISGNWPSTLPAQVVSRDLDGDRKVTVSRTDRLIGLDIAGSIAATLAGLGVADRLVGRDVSTDFPQAHQLPVVTSNGHTVNSEAIIALAPDLVITDGTVGPVDVIMQLRDAGITVVFVDAASGLSGAAKLARQVGEAIGMAEAGAALASQLDAAIATKTAEIAKIVPPGEPLRMLFLYLRGASGIYYLFGHGTGADELITSVGGVDVASQIGIAGQRPMTDEALIAAAPDLIIVMTEGLDSMGGADKLVEHFTALALTPAGQRHRIVDIADAVALSFGPRTPAVLDALARAIYAP